MLLAFRLQRILPIYYGWVVVGASGTAVFARMATAITTLTVFIYPMSQELGWSRTLIAGAVSAGALSSMVLSPAIGWAIDRFGSRPVLVAGVLTVGASMTSLAWATIPATFYLAYAAGRVVFHTAAPIGASTVASRWFIRMRGRAIGVIFFCGAVGGVVFTMLAAVVINNFGVGAAWISLGVICLAVALLPNLLLVVERPEDLGLSPDGDPHDKAVMVANAPVAPQGTAHRVAIDSDSWTVRETARTLSFWVLALMGFATFFVHAGVNVHIAAYLRDEGLSLTNAATVVTASWVVSAAGSVGWGWLMERLPARIMYSFMLAMLSMAVLLLFLASSIAGAFAAAVLIGMVAAGGNIIPAVVYADYFGRASLGKIRGMGEIGVLIGQSTGPLLAGVVFDLKGSYTLIFLVFAATAAAGSLLVLAARRPARIGAPAS
jgi:MFS family permease